MLALLNDPAFWFDLGQIMLVNIVLSGDNAVVIALAARSLPAPDRKRAIVLGSVAATVVALAPSTTSFARLVELAQKAMGG